jgi:hypothetical protein
MSFLQILKDTLQSKLGQAVIAEVPDAIHAGAEIAANPHMAIQTLAELVAQSFADIHARLEKVETVATPAYDSSAPLELAASAAPTIDAQAIEQIVLTILETINPQLAKFEPLLDLIAQHFPHLQTAQSKPAA